MPLANPLRRLAGEKEAKRLLFPTKRDFSHFIHFWAKWRGNRGLKIRLKLGFWLIFLVGARVLAQKCQKWSFLVFGDFRSKMAQKQHIGRDKIGLFLEPKIWIFGAPDLGSFLGILEGINNLA